MTDDDSSYTISIDNYNNKGYKGDDDFKTQNAELTEEQKEIVQKFDDKRKERLEEAKT